tara:strand:+ start:6775 stop:8439 length:1665 start_codon:yes stop_codon:yes gene_type:complete
MGAAKSSEHGDVENAKNQKLLAQASQIAGDLQTQVDELDRRENSLNSQHAQLDQERRSARLSADQQRQALDRKTEELDERQRQADQRSAEMDARAEELSSAEAEVEVARKELSRQRDSLSADIQSELDADRRRLAETEADFKSRANMLEAEHATRLDQLEKDFARRSAELRGELTHQLMSDELRAERKQLDRDREEWARQRDIQGQELKRGQAGHDQEVQKFEAELSERAADQAHELELIRKRQERELDDARQAFAAEQEAIRSETQQERALMENRHLFQQEHLAKARSMLEVDQASFRQEMQQQRTELTRRVEMLDALRRQLAHCRRLLDDRESLLERGLQGLERKTRAAEASRQQHEQRLATARENWQAKREEQREEVAALREHLRSESQSLQERKQRIETLREELEGSHRESLELRLAVEESMATMREEQGEVDDEQAMARLEIARKAVAEHYSQMREMLVTQRADLEDAQKQLAAQVAQQQKIYSDHGERLTERDRDLRAREEELRRQATGLPDGETRWQQMQTRWAAEKQQAETIIRDLLKQLGETPAA